QRDRLGRRVADQGRRRRHRRGRRLRRARRRQGRGLRADRHRQGRRPAQVSRGKTLRLPAARRRAAQPSPSEPTSPPITFSPRLTFLARVLPALLALLLALRAQAQNYPARPIRLIVPIAVGSVTDVIMRAAAPELGTHLSPIVVENKGGASGIPGAQSCAQAQPDGYTICLVYHSTMSINPLIFDHLPYDPDRDFVPITNLFLLVEGLFVST